MALKRSSIRPRSAPSRTEFERLRSECLHLKHEIELLRHALRRQATDLRVQFTRIAQMQAVLDHARAADLAARLSPRPLYRAEPRES